MCREILDANSSRGRVVLARKPKISIGTAVFGMNYGVDPHGLLLKKVKHPEVGKILGLAGLAGIRMIDTAAVYGSAIKALGRYSNKIDTQGMDLVYKLPTFHKINRTILNTWDAMIVEDLGLLKAHKFHCIMMHNAQDLLQDNSPLLFNYLTKLKQAGACDKIGVSVYYPHEMTQILDKFDIDIVQIPCSIFDQRFDRTYLSKIKRRTGVEIHSRSLFLQGKIFQDPKTLGSQFKALRHRLEDIKTLGLTPLEASLDFLAGTPEIDYGIIGIHSATQLTEIILEYRKTTGRHDWTAFMIPNPKEINPNLW